MTPRRAQDPATQTNRRWTTAERVVAVALVAIFLLLLAIAGGQDQAAPSAPHHDQEVHQR